MPRSSTARLVALGLALSAVVALTPIGCGTDAVGIEACRQIEAARCEAAPSCEGSNNPFGVTDDTVDECVLFYRDHCRVGIENTGLAEVDTETVDACVGAIGALADCQRRGAATVGACEGLALTAGADTTAAPCAVLGAPENLAACAFIELIEEDDDGGDTTTSTGGGSDGGGGAGGA